MFYRHQTLYSTQNQTHTAVLTSHCDGRCGAQGRSTCRAARINGGRSDLKGRGQGGVACLSTACSTVKVTVTRRINTHCHRTCQKWWWKRWTVTVMHGIGFGCCARPVYRHGAGTTPSARPVDLAAPRDVEDTNVVSSTSRGAAICSRSASSCRQRRVVRLQCSESGRGTMHLRLTPVEAHAVTPARVTTTVCFLATFLQA